MFAKSVLVVVIATSAFVVSFPNGAPADTCVRNNLPKHFKTQSLPLESIPYQFVASADQYGPGSEIQSRTWTLPKHSYNEDTLIFCVFLFQSWSRDRMSFADSSCRLKTDRPTNGSESGRRRRTPKLSPNALLLPTETIGTSYRRCLYGRRPITEGDLSTLSKYFFPAVSECPKRKTRSERYKISGPVQVSEFALWLKVN